MSVDEQHVVVELSDDPESSFEIIQEPESEDQEVVEAPELNTQEAVQQPDAPSTSSTPAPEPKRKVPNTFASGDIREKAKRSTMDDYHAREQDRATKAKAHGKANLKDNKAQKDTKRKVTFVKPKACLLYTSPSPRDQRGSRMPSSA